MRRKQLTLKQERFVREYVKDGNATRAVKEAYPNIKTKGARRTMGAKLVTNANVQKRIVEILDEAGLTPELLVGELKKLIQDDNKSIKIRAIRTTAEIMGLIGSSGTIMANQVNIEKEISEQEEAIIRKYAGM